MKRKPHEYLSELMNVPADVTLEQSLQRAERIQSSRRRTQRIWMIIALVVIVTMGLFVARDPLADVADAPRSSYGGVSQRSSQLTPQAVPPEVSAPSPTSENEMNLVAMPRTSAKWSEPVKGAHSGTRFEILYFGSFKKPLNVDLFAMESIARIIAPGDRVVAVENRGGAETCINVTCAGGDSRSIVCTAPTPSPVRLTSTDGRLLYDIDRPGQSQEYGSYVAVLASGLMSDVLLWYRLDEHLERLLPETSKQFTKSDALYGWLRPDSSVVVSCPTGGSPWTKVKVLTPLGDAAPVGTLWVEHPQDMTELRLRMNVPGTYDLQILRENGSRGRFLLVVR